MACTFIQYLFEDVGADTEVTLPIPLTKEHGSYGLVYLDCLRVRETGALHHQLLDAIGRSRGDCF